MSQAPQTFEEARRDWSEEREEEGEEPFYALEDEGFFDEAPLEEQVEALKTIIRASPEDLARRRGTAPISPGDRVSPLQLRLGELDGILAELRDDLESATSTNDFLNNIAQSNLFISERLGVLASTQVEMLEGIFDLVNYISPFDQLTVSGTNEIEDAGTAEPVVPESDNTNIPTKALFIKADADNKDTIAIGDDETDPQVGWVLHPNEHLILNMDLRQEIVYMASDTEDQVVELLGFI